jgi:hypothetical protein
MRQKLFLLPALLLSQFAVAGGLEVSVEVPRLDVAEYHRPYLAIWLEKEGGGLTDLAVWYDVKLKDKEGEKWLKDIRQWWRRSGRSQDFPIDGVSAATRAPGVHKLGFSAGQAPLGELAAGQYTLLVEAAREVGGRELLKIPFTWPASERQVLPAKGGSELGEIVLTVSP